MCVVLFPNGRLDPARDDFAEREELRSLTKAVFDPGNHPQHDAL